MARNLKTSWVIIATSGTTVDGREIDRVWLEEMAEHYNPKVYTAKLWQDHYRFMENGGSVLALKVEPATDPAFEGEIHLMAILAPNDWLIEANRQGQFVHTSIEVSENFMGKGIYYLEGLGVTDTPASAGTTELRFNQRRQHPENRIFSGNEINTCAALEYKPGVFSGLFGLRNQPDSEEDTMTKEQIEALTADLKGHVDTQFSALKAELKPADEDEATPDDAVTAEQFSALNTENEKLRTEMDDLKTQFAALKDSPDGKDTKTTDSAGDGGERRCL
ncbi:MAG: GPO family capsid scaffolding protein [Cellvibrionaceae bacterium]